MKKLEVLALMLLVLAMIFAQIPITIGESEIFTGPEWAEPVLITYESNASIFNVKIFVNISIIEPGALVLNFYTYSRDYQANKTIWNGTAPANITLHEYVEHPLNEPIQNVTLMGLNQSGTVLPMVTFTTCRSDLMGRLGVLDVLWTVPGADRSAIMKEYVAIDGQWPYAPEWSSYYSYLWEFPDSPEEQSTDSSVGTQAIEVNVLTASDEEFGHWGSAPSNIETIIERGDNAFESRFGIDLKCRAYTTWRSNNGERRAGYMLSEAITETGYYDGIVLNGYVIRMFIAFTGQIPSDYHGIPSGKLSDCALISRRSYSDMWHLVQHEVSHLYGCDDHYDLRDCVMCKVKVWVGWRIFGFWRYKCYLTDKWCSDCMNTISAYKHIHS